MKEDARMAAASLVTDPEQLRPVEGPAAWRGRDLAASDDWMYRLSPAEADEVERLAGALRAAGTVREQITRDDVPLGALSTAVRASAKKVSLNSASPVICRIGRTVMPG